MSKFGNPRSLFSDDEDEDDALDEESESDSESLAAIEEAILSGEEIEIIEDEDEDEDETSDFFRIEED